MNSTTNSPVKQTIVLVHGAYADSSSWNGSISALREAGHAVIAVANPLRGLESDAEYLRSVLDSIEGPIVLAGHSYGGYIMSHAAEGNSNVTALVYVASFLAEPGEADAAHTREPRHPLVRTGCRGSAQLGQRALVFSSRPCTVSA